VPIPINNLRDAATRSYRTVIAKSLYEARSQNKQTAFLCHSHKDEELAKGLQVLLAEDGWEVYIDWQDNEMPETPNKETATKIKNKITQTDWFLFLATPNSTSSRWCPWDIGYADSEKQNSKIMIIPTSDQSGRWYGNEYLQLYRRIDVGTSKLRKPGYAVYEPDSTSGTWVQSL